MVDKLALHFNWKGDEAKEPSGASRAQKMYPVLGECDLCIEPAYDRHHVDGNRLNNERSNLMFLCRQHHMVVDGRLPRLWTSGWRPKLDTLRHCVVCNAFVFPLRKGRCHACNEYFRRNGVERQVYHLGDGWVIQECPHCGYWFKKQAALPAARCRPCSRTIGLRKHAATERRRRARHNIKEVQSEPRWRGR